MSDKPWPADKVERWPIDRITERDRNAKLHPEEQVAAIAASMFEWGVCSPLLVDEAGALLAGHGRLRAARKLGLKELPVMVASGWTEAQKRAYSLADNRLAVSGFDPEMLRLELQDLDAEGYTLALTGFSDAELGGFLGDLEPMPGLDEPAPKADSQQTVCPNCGHAFNARV